MSAAAVRPAPRSGIRLISGAIGVAWAVAVVAEATGHGAALHHDSLIEGGLPFGAALALFLVAWQVMTVAMMLPSSLPTIRLFARMSAAQPSARDACAAFVGAYLLVWTVFGAAALTGDLGIHRGVDSWAWLDAHSWLIAGGTLALAGAFQFSSLKERCLTECRHPAAFLMRYYRRGTAAAFQTGLRHGLFCLGCCWAMMLVAFAAGVSNLAWMAAFTAIMVVEKAAPGGERISRPVGVALLTLGTLVIAHPPGFPQLF